MGQSPYKDDTNNVTFIMNYGWKVSWFIDEERLQDSYWTQGLKFWIRQIIIASLIIISTTLTS